MSGKLVSLILQKDIPKGKLVLVTLASYCHGDQLTCWPSAARLARECQVSERWILEVLKEMKCLGYVSSKRAGPKPTIFSIHPEKMPNLTPELQFRSDTATPELQHSLDLNSSSLTPELQHSRNKEEPERTGKGNRKSFVPPALIDVTLYCRERGNNVDPEKFHAYYEANGWRVGRAGLPMKDWRAAVLTWEKNNYGNSDRQTKLSQQEILDRELRLAKTYRA